MCAARGGPGYKYCTKISKQLNINDNQNEQKWLTLENVNLTWKNNDLFYLFLLLFVQENLIKKETETKKNNAVIRCHSLFGLTFFDIIIWTKSLQGRLLLVWFLVIICGE